ncbi:MAG: carboxypeptidase-like regulatory domain-containing protein, partial [candidate division Zixibacteria bacterium]|nr:carboxypeptidase-like regulatory domain-containing protein [candidate division Zixibacteria bacterium]
MDFDLPVIGRQSGFNKYWGLLFLFILLLLIAECTDTVTVSSVPDLVIDSIRAVPDYTLPGGQIELTAVASDIAGRNLSYKWSTYPHAGSFADDTAQTTILTVAGILKAGMSLKVTLDVSNGGKSVTGYKWIAIDTGSTISGYVYYAFTHIPIAGVIVTIANRADTSDSIGYYKLRDIRSDSYTLEAVKDGYDGYSSLVELRGNRVQNIFLTSPGNTAKLTGTVSTMEGNPLEKIQVTVLNDDDSKSELSDTTDIDGGYHLAGVPKGNRRLLIENGGNSPFDVLTDTMAVVITTDSMFCPLRGKMARVVFESNG